MYTFKEFVKNLENFEEDTNWIMFLIDSCRYHDVIERYVVVNEEKITCAEALEQMFRFISETYFNMEWKTPKMDTECIEWLLNDYEECRIEMRDNLEYMQDMYIEFIMGEEDMDYDTFIYTLYNDILTFILHFSGIESGEKIKLKSECKDPKFNDCQTEIDNFFDDCYECTDSLKVFNDIINQAKTRKDKYEQHRVVAEEVFPSWAADEESLPF